MTFFLVSGPTQPRNLVVRNESGLEDSKKSVKITWDVPEVENGNIDQYKILIYLVDSITPSLHLYSVETFKIVDKLGKKYNIFIYIFLLIQRAIHHNL